VQTRNPSRKPRKRFPQTVSLYPTERYSLEAGADVLNTSAVGVGGHDLSLRMVAKAMDLPPSKLLERLAKMYYHEKKKSINVRVFIEEVK
jgi:hypothetical protein